MLLNLLVPLRMFYAVVDVAEDLLLALGAETVPRAEHHPFPIGSLFEHLNYLLLRHLRS